MGGTCNWLELRVGWGLDGIAGVGSNSNKDNRLLHRRVGILLPSPAQLLVDHRASHHRHVHILDLLSIILSLAILILVRLQECTLPVLPGSTHRQLVCPLRRRGPTHEIRLLRIPLQACMKRGKQKSECMRKDDVHHEFKSRI